MLPVKKRKIIFGSLIVIFSLIGLLAAFSLVKKPKKESPSQAAGGTADFWMETGEEEYIMGPTGSPIDSPFFALPNAGGVRGFSANSDTYTFFGPNLNSLNNQGIALPRGQSGRFDECGAWLYSVNKLDENHWLGWYHAENECPYTGGQTHASTAFTESFDGGRTWQKPNYPYNQIITADIQFNGHPASDDTSGGRVIKINDYFYMFYQSTGKYNPDGTPDYSQSDYLTHVARSPVSVQGKPGTWYKYFNGSFSEPGLGGRSTPINTLNSYGNFVSYNSYLNRYLSVLTTGRWGFILYFSSGNSEQDILNGWSGFPVSLGEKSIFSQVSHNTDDRVDNWWTRNSGSKQVYAYASLVSLDGQSDIIGQQFYLYYMKLFDSEDFGSSRYLLRRKITLHKNSESPFPYPAMVALTRYEKQNPKKTKVSTEIARPNEGYQKKTNLGYLLPYEQAGFRPLYECYIPIWNDYFITATNDPSTQNWQHCKDAGDNFIRTIGWISITQTPEANQPLYRCFDEQNTDHFTSLDQSCEGKRQEGLLGYLFNYPFNLTPTPIPGDFDGNGKVNDDDLRFLLAHWNNSEANLTILLSHWQP